MHFDWHLKCQISAFCGRKKNLSLSLTSSPHLHSSSPSVSLIIPLSSCQFHLHPNKFSELKPAARNITLLSELFSLRYFSLQSTSHRRRTIQPYPNTNIQLIPKAMGSTTPKALLKFHSRHKFLLLNPIFSSNLTGDNEKHVCVYCPGLI